MTEPGRYRLSLIVYRIQAARGMVQAIGLSATILGLQRRFLTPAIGMRTLLGTELAERAGNRARKLE